MTRVVMVIVIVIVKIILTAKHSKMLETFISLADQDNLSHASLFFGPKGAEKKELALSLARHLEGNDMRVETLLFEKQTIGVLEIQEIKK